MTEGKRNSVAAVRALGADEIERATAIDAANVGRSRRSFLAKRLRAAQQSAEEFLHLAVDVDGRLAGFALARVLRG